ncbi:hypothetical protein FB451DRAFT_1284374 [Mycena latifolia]|nr:hypothetical protein FB451DRAFT_1284374 [Mycena latifolia]
MVCRYYIFRSTHVSSSSATKSTTTSSPMDTSDTANHSSVGETPTKSSSRAGRTTSTQQQSSGTTTQSSSASVDSSPVSAFSGTPTSVSSSPPGSIPTGGQTNQPSVAVSRKLSGVAGRIAGIVVGTVAFVTLVVALILCVRRRYIRIGAGLEPVFHLELSALRGPALPLIASEKTPVSGIRVDRRVERDGASTISSQAAEIRQEYLRNRIRAAQRELDSMNDGPSPPNHTAENSGENGAGALDDANQGDEALRERIRMLESQFQSQWALGLSDEPPPGYLE